MWLIVPLIYFMSWRSCRSLGQAFSETAAWIVGYLATAGVIVLLNWGSFRIISDAPDGPGALLAIIGGFAGMGVSRYLWKRRGGHLNRKQTNWKQINWIRITGRAVQAMRGTERQKKKAAPSARASARPDATASAASGSRPAGTATTTTTTSSSTAGAAARSASNGQRATRPTSGQIASATVKAAAVAGRELGRNPSVRKAASSRWVRAVGAMLSESDSKKPNRS